MKKVLLLIFTLSLLAPTVLAYDDYEGDTSSFMDFTPSDFGHNQAVKAQQKLKPADPTEKETFESFIDREFDSNGFRRPKPVNTEKKVIKKIGDPSTQTANKTNTTGKPATTDYYSFPKSLDDAQNGLMQFPMIPTMF